MKPIFFRTPAAFREWLEKHHARTDELWVGFHKKDSGRASLTWPESVDEAICFGWIDGVRKSLDDSSYTIRFTPRRPGSTWSSANLARAEALAREGRLRPAGLAAWQARQEEKSGVHSHDQRGVDLEEPYQGLLKQNQAAWDFFRAQPPSYRKVVNRWIMSAKRDETRLKRLEKLIACSADGQRLPEATPSRTERRK